MHWDAPWKSPSLWPPTTGPDSCVNNLTALLLRHCYLMSWWSVTMAQPLPALEIAGQFAKEVSFPVRIYQNESNLGFADNFLKAASLCEGDWIAFSDQDDIWLPHKLATVSRRFNDGVLLVLHSADLVDASLKANGKRWPDIKKDFIAEPLQNRPWWTTAGFTSSFCWIDS